VRLEMRLEIKDGWRPADTSHPSHLLSVAEDRRFELLRGCPQHAFQACALGH
jgi:hypothetical protein